MIFEITREYSCSYITFADAVPVEVREAMRANDITWVSWKGAWGAVGKTDDEIHKIILDAAETVKERPVMSKEEEKALKDEYVEIEVEDGGERWRKYYEGKVGTVVRLTDGRMIMIEKPKIKTRFCFGESGYDAEDAARMAGVAESNENYFRAQNLMCLDDAIRILSYAGHGDYVDERVFLDDNPRDDRLAFLNVGSGAWRDPSTIVDVSEEDRERILEGYRRVRAAFVKRLDAYLKRYGLSKVYAWTYWRDA